MPQVTSLSLRRALGSFATGVTVVTAQGKTVDVGVTADSFSSVPLEPPMVLWSDGRRALVELTAIRLSAEQAALAHLDRSEITVIKDLLRRLVQL